MENRKETPTCSQTSNQRTSEQRINSPQTQKNNKKAPKVINLLFNAQQTSRKQMCQATRHNYNKQNRTTNKP
jgi:hypothetical protein